MTQQAMTQVPSFIVNATKLMALVSGLVVLPLAFFNAYNGNWLVFGLAVLFCFVQFYCAYQCFKNNYHLYLGLLGIIPMMTLGSAYIIYLLGVTGSYWVFLTLFGVYFTVPLKIAKFINIVYLSLVGVTAYLALPFDVYIRFFFAAIGTSVFLFLCVRELQQQHNSLSKASITDVLTGLNNRALLDNTLQHAIDMHQRDNLPVTLLTIDIDHFKTINDTFGHPKGDDVLVEVAKLMRQSFRKTDAMFRVGGEEFLVLLNASNLADSEIVANRFRESVQNARLIDNHQVTLSIGVKTLEPNIQAKDWLAQCDALLYIAKQEGRNRVVCA